jgi:hypothetical protein
MIHTVLKAQRPTSFIISTLRMQTIFLPIFSPIMATMMIPFLVVFLTGGQARGALVMGILEREALEEVLVDLEVVYFQDRRCLTTRISLNLASDQVEVSEVQGNQ